MRECLQPVAIRVALFVKAGSIAIEDPAPEKQRHEAREPRGAMADAFITLTAAQAIVRFLDNQFIEIDGVRRGGSAAAASAFSGTAMSLASAKRLARREGDAAALSRAERAEHGLRRRRLRQSMAAPALHVLHGERRPGHGEPTDRIGARAREPAADVDALRRHVSDAPARPGSCSNSRHFGDPTLGLNDGFRSVSRFWDRITHPAQVIHSLPAALNTMLDPADCGPAFIALPQDVQGWTYDYPTSLFEPRVHRIRASRADAAEIADAARCSARRERPMIIAGGGVQYSEARRRTARLRRAGARSRWSRRSPAAPTSLNDHPLNIGPIGVTGSDSANAIAEQADLVLAVGTRLQDFTTGSWTAFAPDARFIGLNVGRHDAAKHHVDDRGRRRQAWRWSPRWTRRRQGYAAPADWTGACASRARDMERLCRREHARRQRPGLLCAGDRRREREVPSARPGRRRRGRSAGRGHRQLEARSMSAPSMSSSASPAWATRSPAAGARASPKRRSRA